MGRVYQLITDTLVETVADFAEGDARVI